jgi:hypothetical protein
MSNLKLAMDKNEDKIKKRIKNVSKTDQKQIKKQIFEFSE